jgi:hypothetical protein
MTDRHPRGARLSLNVEVMPGSDWTESCQAAMYVADTLEVTVLFDFNTTPVFVVPGDSQKAINQRWDASRADKTQPLPDLGEALRDLHGDITWIAGAGLLPADAHERIRASVERARLALLKVQS